MSSFQHSNLFISLRSPFARRVRIALLEHGITFTETVEDVFKPSQTLIDTNLLARVPTIRLASGQVLIDSHLILAAFYEEATSPWIPESLPERLEMYRLSALATGFTDKTVEFFLESVRPKDKQDPELRADFDAITERYLASLSQTLAGRKALIGTRLTQADIDAGSALSYLSLRYGTAWRAAHTRVAQYLDELETRPSFEKTRPPA